MVCKNFLATVLMIQAFVGITDCANAQSRVSPAPATEAGAMSAFHMVANSEAAGELAVGNARERITGRVSFHLVATRDREVRVQNFNIVFFGVSQKLIAGQV